MMANSRESEACEPHRNPDTWPTGVESGRNSVYKCPKIGPLHDVATTLEPRLQPRYGNHVYLRQTVAYTSELPGVG